MIPRCCGASLGTFMYKLTSYRRQFRMPKQFVIIFIYNLEVEKRGKYLSNTSD